MLLSLFGSLIVFYLVFKITSTLIKLIFTPSVNWTKWKGQTNYKKWALVTGSTDGIGKEFALQLAKKGFNIIIAARNQDKLKKTTDEIKMVAKEALVESVQIDFSSNDLGALIKKIEEKGNDLTVLINNVGVSHEHPEYFHECTPETIQNIIAVNISSVLNITQQVIPLMLKNKNGLIMNIGSFSGEVPIPLLQTYGASKAFLKHWSLSLASELAPQGITVQLVNTYFVVSNLSKRKRATWLIPTPKTFTQSALRAAGKGPFITPYWPHALVYTLMGLIPSSLLTTINLASMRAVRQAALQKGKKQ